MSYHELCEWYKFLKAFALKRLAHAVLLESHRLGMPGSLLSQRLKREGPFANDSNFHTHMYHVYNNYM